MRHTMADGRAAARGRPYLSARWVLAVALVLLGATVVLAQSAASYDLSWNTVDAGGGTFSAGGGYSLGGTAGQPDAGLLAGGVYALAGGFWPGGAAAAPHYMVYLPLVLRGD